jgi:hypothetical protein
MGELIFTGKEYNTEPPPERVPYAEIVLNGLIYCRSLPWKKGGTNREFPIRRQTQEFLRFES